MSIFLQTDIKNVAFKCGFIEIKNNDEHNNKRKGERKRERERERERERGGGGRE